MSTEGAVNGDSANEGLTAAQKLMQKHEVDEALKTTVEEVPDEDAIQHPPPSASLGASSAEPALVATPAPPMSAKAAGKQHAQESPTTSGATQPSAPINTQSEEAFPSLGAPKSQHAGTAPSPWSRKPAAVGKAANGIPNGMTNGHPASSNRSSRASMPLSGIASANSTVPSQRGPTPQMALPGKYSEQISLDPSKLTPRSQLKKPVQDILRDINKRSKAKVAMKQGAEGMIVFEGTGPVDAVRSALKEVASQLCAKDKASIQIPHSIRGRVVGKQGATIQAISKKTGARINISKQEAVEILEDEDDSATVDVTIEGDPFAVELARQDIMKIVNEHTSSVNQRLKNIPAEYYAFLTGPHNAGVDKLEQGKDVRVQIPQYNTWSEQAPPQAPPNRQPAVFSPQAGLSIQLAGDREAVAQARAELEKQVLQLQRELTLEQMAIERGRHQFIVGDKGTSLHDFLQETGCAVILPPDGDDSEMLTIVGPPDRLEEGMNKIMDLASSMSMASVDIARQHPNAPRGAQAHARDITRYLQQRQAIQQLERIYEARIVPDSSSGWQVYAKDGKNAMKARSDIMNLISGHPPTRFSPIDVDPFYHEHLRQQAASQIREHHGVHVVVPDDLDDSAQVLLVFEGSSAVPDYELPRKAPTTQDVQAFERALHEAQQDILRITSGQQQIISKDVDAPVKFHDKIRRHVDRHTQSLPSGRIPVQVNVGGRPAPGQRLQRAPSVAMRGPQDTVDELTASLLAFIEQEKQDELERGFTLSFDFPQKFANFLIGRKGENINKLREEFDVDIQLQDGKCEIKGPEAKANACKAHIISLAKKLEDEATYVLNIPPQYHRDLIGAAGSQVNRLQDRYNVRVNFPRNRQAADDASSVADAEPSSRRNNQAPHEVMVKGPKKGADECRDELLSLLQYAKDNSYSDTVSVAQGQLPSLIGTGGKEMEAMRLETGAQIDVPGSRDAASPTGRVEIKLKGSKTAVANAKKMLEERAKVFDSIVSRTLDVDKKYHRTIIGGQGSNLRKIVVDAGGPDDTRQHARMVRFPKAEAEGNTIRVEADNDIAEKICAAIEAFVNEQQSQTTAFAEVKPEKHRLLIGRGGEIRRNLEQQFKVQINVPRQGETSAQKTQVRIQGQPSDVDRCKAHILQITKDQEGETVQVPRRFHHTIADNGHFFRRLKSDNKVTVDHAGQRPPPRPTAPTPSRTDDGGDLPLITDDHDPGAGTHSWKLHDLHSSAEEGEIPWVLSGPNPEAISAAKSKLDKAVAEAGKQTHIGFLILPDPRAYRFVIGQGGSEINRIRKQTGTKIQVPRDQSQGEAIVISGDQAGLEEAKDIILELVANNS